MANGFANVFKIPDLRKRIFFTLAILIVYRIGCHIPIPGIDVDALKYYFENSAGGGFVDFFDLFAGGALKNFTIFALGIMPYISSSIILQLLTVVVPSLEALSKEGMEGRKKISQYTKYLTVVLCLVQGGLITNVMRKSGGNIVPVDAGFGFVIFAMIIMTTGTMVLMWLGELITEKGVGNGISLIIFAGIVVRLPSSLHETAVKIQSKGDPILGIILVFLFLLVVAASIMLTLGRRNIPLQQGRRSSGTLSAQQSQSLPIPLNAANVIPIIFASSILMFPSQIASMVGAGGSNNPSSFWVKLQYWFAPGQTLYIIVYAILIILITYFYSTIVFNPEEVADNLKKHQVYVPGIRPGADTENYLAKVLNLQTFWGAIFLTLIAIVPDLILKLWPDEVSPAMAMMFGGTSLLIIVGVALDTLKQIESHLIMHHYDGFFKNGKMKGRR